MVREGFEPAVVPFDLTTLGSFRDASSSPVGNHTYEIRSCFLG
jgi:hypothetical protein